VGIPKKRLIAAPLIFAVAIASLTATQKRIDAIKDTGFDEDLLFLPNEHLLSHFTAGLSSVIADLLWVRTIDYASKEFHNPERKFTWLSDLIHMVVRLDPYFEGAYANGGMLLAGIGADEDALDILNQGLRINPRSYAISFELLQVFILNRREREETPRLIGHYLQIAADLAPTEEYSQYYLELAENIERKHDLTSYTIRRLQDIIENSDSDLSRKFAEERLLILIIRKNVGEIDRVLTVYSEQSGNKASSLDEVFEAGALVALTGNPEHGRYFIDPEGAVQNTVLLDAQKAKVLRAFNANIRRFNNEQGRFPDSLEEWSKQNDTQIPKHPYSGEAWLYDRETGNVH
jgi:hypothetical protein